MTTEFSKEQLRHPYVVERQEDYPPGWWIKNEITEAALKFEAGWPTYTSKVEAHRLCNVMNRVYADVFDFVQSLQVTGNSHE